MLIQRMFSPYQGMGVSDAELMETLAVADSMNS